MLQNLVPTRSGIPSGGAVVTARALATVYGAFASLGFMKPSAELDFGSDAAFGPRSGRFGGIRRPRTAVGLRLSDRMGTRLQGDPRGLAL